MTSTPAGTLTFVLTDIAGSTVLWRDDAEFMRSAVPRHEQIVARIADRHGGEMVLEQGEGDSTLAVFSDAAEATLAAIEIASQMREDEHLGGRIKVRIGIHTGVAERRGATYFGFTLSRCARIRSTAHPGQVLASSVVHELLRERAPSVSVVDLGLHRLKDLGGAERLYELRNEGDSNSFPPLSTLSSLPNNLPANLSSFIPRPRCIYAIKELLGSSRLVSLTGAGGSGKTRLALQIAAEEIDRFADGCFFVDVTCCRTEADVLQAVCGVLGITGADEGFSSVAHSRLLLIVDNSESALTGCARVLKRLLLECPDIQVLCTTREPLRVAGESLYHVPCLTLPNLNSDDLLGEMGDSEAIQLLLTRTAAKQSTFRLTEANAMWIAKIAHRLDGIPLALELAAPKLRLLGPEQFYGKLDKRFSLLASNDPTESTRHKTMRAAVEYSYEQLREDERNLLNALSVFIGGFTVEAAEFLCSALPELPDDGLPAIEQLYDKSLIVAHEDVDGPSRFSMYETIREFAQEELSQSDMLESAREQFVRWFLNSSEAATAGDKAHSDGEFANVRAALDICQLRPELHELGLALFVAHHRTWLRLGLFADGVERVSTLRKPVAPDCDLQANACNILGVLHWYLAQRAEAASNINFSLTYWRQKGDLEKAAACLNNLGMIASTGGDPPRAVSHFTEAIELFEALNNPGSVAKTAVNLGALELDQSSFDAANTWFSRALQIQIQLDDHWGLAINHGNIALANYGLGKAETSLAHLVKSLQFTSEVGDYTSTARLFELVGIFAANEADAQTACRMLGASETLREQVDNVEKHERGNRLLLQTLVAELLDLPGGKAARSQGRRSAVANNLRAAVSWCEKVLQSGLPAS